MTKPQVVADCVDAMRTAVSIPVTVKHRIGVDDLDRYEDMAHFVEVVSQAGCDRFSVHARKAWLQGLSPKQNRNVPPLRYDDVYRLKQDFPEQIIEINGGILTLEQTLEQLPFVDAVMVGRAAYDRPYDWVGADASLFNDPRPLPSRHEVVEGMIPYVEEWTAKGVKLLNITRHMLNLFVGKPGTKAFKRTISTHPNPPAHEVGRVLRHALAQVPSNEDPASITTRTV